jgi:hypothetical protein
MVREMVRQMVQQMVRQMVRQMVQQEMARDDGMARQKIVWEENLRQRMVQ